jgi:hypothetical protein
LLLGMESEIVPTPEHSDDSVSLILDEGMAFTGDLPKVRPRELSHNILNLRSNSKHQVVSLFCVVRLWNCNRH